MPSFLHRLIRALPFRLPLALARSPIDYPPMAFYLLWHDRAHYAEECRWFREQLVAVARASAATSNHPASGPAQSILIVLQVGINATESNILIISSIRGDAYSHYCDVAHTVFNLTRD